jgi:thiol-disulfide isomerase/thioredoxin
MATRSERFMAIFIGVIMLGSVAGFAIISSTPPNPQAPEIPSVVKRQLTTDETLFILRNGKVLIEDFYTEDCSDCFEKNVVLESFANRFRDFIVLEEVVVNQTNQTMLQMIGANGKIVSLENISIEENSLLDVFCEVAIAQPIECLL